MNCLHYDAIQQSPDLKGSFDDVKLDFTEFSVQFVQKFVLEQDVGTVFFGVNGLCIGEVQVDPQLTCVNLI